MDMPSKDQIRAVGLDLLIASLVEAALFRVARQVRHGEPGPRRRWIRRAANAAAYELIAQSAGEMYWQRQRIRSAVSRRVVAELVVADHKRKRPRLPTQRDPSQPELAPTNGAEPRAVT